jgi:sugar phosphate isomerase/epimerase
MKSKLAAQMYTVRYFTITAPELATTLEKIARIGYTGVQMSAVGAMNGETPEVSAAQGRKMLDDNGLKCIATHRGWENFVRDIDREIEFHHTIGCDYAAIGGIPGPYNGQGAEGYVQWVRDALPIVAKLKDAGIRFGYHNHAYEFERVGPERSPLYDIIVQEGGADMMLELDVYWAEHAGFNPVRLIERLHGKLPVVHVKDKEVVGHDPVMAPVGEGNLDWSTIIPALEAAGVEWYAVEQDECRRDPFDCLKSSYDFLGGFGG